jgi:hypothetical protein
MGFTALARRAILAPALALALAAAVAACSSSSSSSSSSSAPVTSAPATSAAASTPAAASTSGAVAEITANWEKFFSSSTPVSEKVTLLQNGDLFSGAISSLMSLVSGLGSTVTGVTLNSPPTSATVNYNLTASGSSLLSGQTGTSVYEDGVWKVGDTSLCALLKLVPGGSEPAACSSAG